MSGPGPTAVSGDAGVPGTAATHGSTVVAGLVLSLLLGVVTAALGAALPLLRASYGTGDTGDGTDLVFAYNAGALAALLGCARLERRVPGRVLVAWLIAAFSAGCGGMSMAPVWWVLTGWALVTGIGFGGLVLYANTYFGRPGGAHGVRLLNWLHAAFGAGATAGPLLVGATGAVREVLWAVTALALCCAPFRRAGAAPSSADPAGGIGTQHAGPNGHGTPRQVHSTRRDLPGTPVGGVTFAGRRSVLVACALTAFGYAGVEAGVGALEATHLIAAGYAPDAAARLTALFWAGLTVGRLLLPLAARHVSHPLLVALSLCAGAAGLAAATHSALAPTAYGLAGLCLAGAFPTLLGWAVTVLPSARQRVSGVLLTANLAGSAALPLAFGRFTDPGAPASIPLALAALAVAAAAALLAAVRSARPTGADRTPAAGPSPPVPAGVPAHGSGRPTGESPDERKNSA
ncbi:MFS transporter [Streptomyces sp. NPDC005931]|uniref:MFS transporter n=1 Tax=Streptomyces sp. NPDC005931 TaxID=3364737 RepID=UPI0036C77843